MCFHLSESFSEEFIVGKTFEVIFLCISIVLSFLTMRTIADW